MAKQQKKFILTAIKLCVSGTLIYWILQNTNLAEIFSVIGSVNLFLILVATFLKFLGYYVSALRWRILLKAQGINASIHFLFQSYVVTSFFNNFLPSIIGGDTVRAYDSWRLGTGKVGAVAVIFIDRFLGLLALILFAVSAMFMSRQLSAHLPFLHLWMLLGTTVMISIIWMVFMPSEKILMLIKTLRFPYSQLLKNFLAKIINPFLAFQGQKDILYRAFGLSVLLQTNVIIHFYLIAMALEFPIPFNHFFLIIPLSIFIMMLPISINGIGIRESIFAFFFLSYGVSKPEAVAFAWLVYGITILQGVVGGIVYALRK
ncbi:lysylphosphatidylglycerol synthase transmembrane domain-containing protein [Calothrix rhizosoleniae]|uniref:lysylphosphatidylglycerol synthase transmembrane domain-containing protein n=1 Tax=Calothrix rhizosoleniae TaxID=888997 RepID=UPI0013566303|nr:lysylphosphatidylglycerol synthase transmembrane domain-containing protein [Calothrix rhizosoleniae]